MWNCALAALMGQFSRDFMHSKMVQTFAWVQSAYKMSENDGNGSAVLTQLGQTYSNEGWTIWKHNLAFVMSPAPAAVIRRVWMWNKLSNTFMLASFYLRLICVYLLSYYPSYPLAVLMFVIFRNLGLWAQPRLDIRLQIHLHQSHCKLLRHNLF